MAIPTNPSPGMNGDILGEEIAAEIVATFFLLGFGRASYIFNSRWFVPMWQAVGRAIVRHIIERQVITTPVIDYMPGAATTDFESRVIR